MRLILFLTALFCLSISGYAKEENVPRLALVCGGNSLPEGLLALTEADLFDDSGIVMIERTEIDKILSEQKISGLFGSADAMQLGRILQVNIFAVLERRSVVVFDAETGLRYADESLSDDLESSRDKVARAIKDSARKWRKRENNELPLFGVLEVRNADFPVERDAWCKAVVGLLERELLENGAGVLERSRLVMVSRERTLTRNDSNHLLASMNQIDLEFTRGKTVKTFIVTARIGEKIFREEGPVEAPFDAVKKLAGKMLRPDKTVTDPPQLEIDREMAAPLKTPHIER